eukprot:m.284849 g.284849  ORF g.284849 m.284849 type:complete len:106 (-) comp19914_c0_seq5:1528-1845(-)
MGSSCTSTAGSTTGTYLATTAHFSDVATMSTQHIYTPSHSDRLPGTHIRPTHMLPFQPMNCSQVVRANNTLTTHIQTKRGNMPPVSKYQRGINAAATHHQHVGVQ